jgi:hypothetical protein
MRRLCGRKSSNHFRASPAFSEGILTHRPMKYNIMKRFKRQPIIAACENFSAMI